MLTRNDVRLTLEGARAILTTVEAEAEDFLVSKPGVDALARISQ